MTDTLRKFCCIGPFCWGMGDTKELAIKNAKKNRVKIYEGKRGWRYVLYDIAVDVIVDDMGGFCYYEREGELPYVEVARFNMEVAS